MIKLITGAAVKKDDWLRPDDSGRAVPTTIDDKRIIARAVTEAVDSGMVIEAALVDGWRAGIMEWGPPDESRVRGALNLPEPWSLETGPWVGESAGAAIDNATRAFRDFVKGPARVTGPAPEPQRCLFGAGSVRGWRLSCTLPADHAPGDHECVSLFYCGDDDCSGGTREHASAKKMDAAIANLEAGAEAKALARIYQLQPGETALFVSTHGQGTLQAGDIVALMEDGTLRPRSRPDSVIIGNGVDLIPLALAPAEPASPNGTKASANEKAAHLLLRRDQIEKCVACDTMHMLGGLTVDTDGVVTAVCLWCLQRYSTHAGCTCAVTRAHAGATEQLRDAQCPVPHEQTDPIEYAFPDAHRATLKVKLP